MQLLFYTGFLGIVIFFNIYGETADPLAKLKNYEIELIRDSRMPIVKLQQISNAGVTVEEYFQYPWLKLNISEKEWLDQRNAGIIKGEDYSTQQLKHNQWAVIQNFFIPGLHQFKRKQTFKGILMSGIAVGSLALFALHRAPDKKGPLGFDYPAYLAVLGADLFWSSIDLGVQVNREFDNGAKRFSLHNGNGNPAIALNEMTDNSNSCFNLQISPLILKD